MMSNESHGYENSGKSYPHAVLLSIETREQLRMAAPCSYKGSVGARVSRAAESISNLNEWVIRTSTGMAHSKAPAMGKRNHVTQMCGYISLGNGVSWGRPHQRKAHIFSSWSEENNLKLY